MLRKPPLIRKPPLLGTFDLIGGGFLIIFLSAYSKNAKECPPQAENFGYYKKAPPIMYLRSNTGGGGHLIHVLRISALEK